MNENYAPPGVPKVIKDVKAKPAFEFDCLTQIKGLDPTAPKCIEFDWEVLRRSLHEAREEMGETDYEALAQVLRELLRWIVKGGRLDTIGRRAVALAWVVNPDIFPGGPSAMKLAKIIGCHNRTLSADAAEASRAFGVRNHAQDHAWNFQPDGAIPRRSKRASEKRKASASRSRSVSRKRV